MNVRTNNSINDDDNDRMPNFLVLLSFSRNIDDNTALSGTCSVANGSCSLAFTYTYCLARSTTRTSVYGMELENSNNVSWNTDSIEQAGKERDQGAVISLYPCKREEDSILHVVGEPNKTQSIDQAAHPELLGRRTLVVLTINTVPTQKHYVADSLS